MKILLVSILIVFTIAFLPNELDQFAVLGSSTVTNSGSSLVNGDIGLYPGTSITGFPPGQIIGGAQQVNNNAATLGQQKLITFASSLSSLACQFNFTGQDLGGKTLTPGIYCTNGGATITGILTLDGQNSSSPLWVFQISTTLDTSSSSQILFVNGSSPCNVFWNLGTSATLGASSSFKGVINAYSSISLGTSAAVVGKLLAQNGAVTLLTNTISNCTENFSNITSLTCFGILFSSSTVCGTRGTCTFTDFCVCNIGYTGKQCQFNTCNGISSNSSNVCSGNGYCNAPNSCSCNSGWSGNDCSIPVCYGVLGNSTTVCSGRGNCSAPNNCVCNDMSYSGLICSVPSCFSVNATSPSVCSGNGFCNSLNNCTCFSDFNGTQCNITMCPASSIAILAATGISNDGATSILGDIAISPGIALTGFPPGKISGLINIKNTIAGNAQGVLTQKYNQIAALPCGRTMDGIDLGGLTLAPGVYCFAAGAQLTGTVYLDSSTNPSPYWVFQMGTTLTTSTGSKIAFTKLSSPCTVFWNVGSSATIGQTSDFSGNVLAYTSISVGTGASINGKLLASNGAVSLLGNAVTNCPYSCTTMCYGLAATDPNVCSGSGTCTYPGYCVCRSGTNGTTCSTSNANTLISISFIVIFIFYLL